LCIFRSQLTEFIEVHSCNFGKNRFDLTKLICILHFNTESILCNTIISEEVEFAAPGCRCGLSAMP